VGGIGYRPALDGVRGLAIALVVSLHAFGWPHDGSVGVDLFFVLSGFLITTLLLEERAATGTVSLTGFYRRRAARLMPALVVLLGVYAIVTGGANAWAIFVGATYTTNIAQVLDPNLVPFALSHLWSLAQEEQFYLLWPPLLLLILRGKPGLLPRVLVTMIFAVVLEKLVLSALGASENRIYAGPDTHAGPLLVGCLFAALYSGERSLMLRRLGTLAPFAVVGGILLAQWRPILNPFSPLRTAFAFACAFLIIAALDVRVVERTLSARPLRSLGRISYSLYLWHVPVLAAAGATGYDQRPARSVLTLCLAVAVAAASFYLVEQPLRKRWRERRSTGMTPVVQPST
jgi:peptidoglycan/LPS O-acetylase OafA/YrhL